MNTRSSHRQQARCILALAALLAVQGARLFAAGNVVSDGSLGPLPVGFAGGVYSIPRDAGMKVGSNLFHSFDKFGLDTNETARFDDLGGIDRVIARVTGGAKSSIDGKLSCAASLFLINPTGVVFGPNASLDVRGSFTVSTAHSVSLSDGGKFFAALGQGDSLTSAPISAFGFTAKPAAVEFNGTQFSIADGTSMHVIAGDVTLDGASISTFAIGPTNDSVTIFSAASKGEVPFSAARPGVGYATAKFPATGNVALRNGATTGVSGEAGGRVVIRAGKLSVDSDSSIASSVNGSGIAGTNIEITANQLSLTNGGSIASYAQSDVPGGGIGIKAGRIDVSGARSLIVTLASAGNAGRAGNLRIDADTIAIRSGGSIAAKTESSGNGGDLFVKARTLSIDSGANLGTRADIDVTGRAGNVALDIRDSLTLTRDAFITASTFGLGRGGDVRINAGSIALDASRIVSDSERADSAGSIARGSSGDVAITTRGKLTATRGSVISASTFGPGAGGKVSVTAHGGIELSDRATFVVGTQGPGAGGSLSVKTPSLLIDGTRSQEAAPTGLIAQSKGSGNGRAGSIAVEAGRLTMLGGAIIEATTGSENPGGSISVVADEITLDGRGARFLPSGLPLATSISARTVAGATGAGGDVTVKARRSITLRERGEIEAATEGSGRGGNVFVSAGSLSAEGSSYGFPSGVLARGAAGATGAAGSVKLQLSGNLRLANRAEISSNNLGLGVAGSVQISAADVALDRASLTVRALSNDAGDLSLHANDVLLRDSAITAEAAGNGGNIVLGARFLELIASQLTANAIAGNGGLITLEIPATGVLGDSRDFVVVSEFVRQDSASRITASSEQGVEGALVIQAPRIDLSNALEGFDDTLIDASTQLRELCARRLGLDFSSLLVLGRGGAPLAPDDRAPSSPR